MTSTFTGGTSYVQSTDVFDYLKISSSAKTEDATWLDDTIIPFVCEYIDRIGATTWGAKVRLNEWKSIGQYASYGLYLIGAPIYLEYYPVIPVTATNENQIPSITSVNATSLTTPPSTSSADVGQSLVSMLIWNGNFYNQWVGQYTEGRWSQYWVDTWMGIIYVMGWYWWMGYEAKVSYQFGFNEMAGVTAGTGFLNPYVYELALLKASQMFLSNERYTSTISQGIGGIEIPDEWSYLERRTKDLEVYVKGFRRMAGSWMS